MKTKIIIVKQIRGKENVAMLTNSCLYLNALELYIIENKPSIIGVTEPWANRDIGDSELNLEGYERIVISKMKKEMIKKWWCSDLREK